MAHYNNKQKQFELNVSTDTLKRIILKGDAQTLVESAESVGGKLGRNLKTNQIRAIFGTVRQIEMNWDDKADAGKRQQAQRDLILLKPKMAYQAKRDGYKGKGLFALSEVLSEAIDLVMAGEDNDQRQRFSYFVDYFEAILAYHKVAGGS